VRRGNVGVRSRNFSIQLKTNGLGGYLCKEAPTDCVYRKSRSISASITEEWTERMSTKSMKRERRVRGVGGGGSL